MKTRTRTHAPSRALAKSSTLLLTASLALFAQASADVCRAQSQTQPQSAARPAGVAAAGEKGARERSPGAITGRVVGESGEPLPGALVYAGLRGVSAQLTRTQRVSTDDEGNFQITGLDPGLYTVIASMPGYVTDTDFSTGRPPAYRTGDTALLRLVKGGVITGAVTDTQGEAIVGLGVRAYRVRDLDGRPVTFGYNPGFEDRTDDRGVYRIFGLLPGVYVVAAGSSGRSYFYGYAAAYAGDVATFYPSATRDTASEITVRAGQESAGVDIRFRDEQGRSVTGRVEPPAGSQADPGVGFNVTLAYASTGIQAGLAFVQPNVLTFSFDGVADGDYDVQASAGGREGQLSVSAPQRVSVRGADVSGLKLTLAPLASVSGSLAIEQSKAEGAGEACRRQRASTLPQETLVTLVADRPAPAKGQAASRTSLTREATPDASGAFTLRGLEAGRYRLLVRPFDEALYVRSVQLPATAAPPQASAPDSGQGPAAKTAGRTGSAAAPSQASRGTAPREGLDVRAGQQLSGVSVRLAEGAALLSGRVAAAEGSAPSPFSQLRVYLVPAEREGADDLLRYFDATPDASGAFAFRSLPPGRYLLVARPAPEHTPDAPPRAPYWDADSRARLRREAESANSTVGLQPCQRTTDFVLRLPK